MFLLFRIFGIMDWSSKWLLEPNFDKCHVIRYSSSLRPIYFFGREKTRPVHFADGECDLGVVFDNSLTFLKHSKSKISKFRSSAYFLKCFFSNLGLDSFCNLYEALVRP